jgi:hypothetical protein
MFSNKKYRNESLEAIKMSNALKRIAIAKGKVKTAENEGYIGMSIRDCNNFLEELKSILEGGNDNGLS